MNSLIEISAQDGHQLDAYLSEPSVANAKAGVVIIQEIFGITDHLKYVADQLADQGYRAIVPALFDRIEKGLLIPYDQVEKGVKVAGQCAEPNVLNDIKAAMDYVSVDGNVAVMGYCMGGTFAYLSACRLSPSVAISYYGTQITQSLDERPSCPVLFHFGEKDAYVPPEHVEQIRRAHPDQAIYIYEDADHGFSCKDRASYHAPSSDLAWQRTNQFLSDHFT